MTRGGSAPAAPCRICRAEDGHSVHTVREMMFGSRETFDYLECGGCGCLQIIAPPEDMARHYPQGYYSFRRKRALSASPFKRYYKRKWLEHSLGRPSLAGWIVSRKRGAPRFSQWVRFSGVSYDDPILDVGCGSGRLLMEMRQAGFNRLEGADPFLDESIEYARGLRVRKASMADLLAAGEAGAYRLVMLHHSLEHMEDQALALSQAAELASPGGCVLVRIPVKNSEAWTTYGVNWVQIDAPRHLYLHTADSLGRIAALAGLDLERTVHDSTDFQFWGSEQYARDIPLNDPISWSVNPEASPFTINEVKGMERRAMELNRQGRGDQAAFYLRKPARPRSEP